MPLISLSLYLAFSNIKPHLQVHTHTHTRLYYEIFSFSPFLPTTYLVATRSLPFPDVFYPSCIPAVVLSLPAISLSLRVTGDRTNDPCTEPVQQDNDITTLVARDSVRFGQHPDPSTKNKATIHAEVEVDLVASSWSWSGLSVTMQQEEGIMRRVVEYPECAIGIEGDPCDHHVRSIHDGYVPWISTVEEPWLGDGVNQVLLDENYGYEYGTDPPPSYHDAVTCDLPPGYTSPITCQKDAIPPRTTTGSRSPFAYHDIPGIREHKGGKKKAPKKAVQPTSPQEPPPAEESKDEPPAEEQNGGDAGGGGGGGDGGGGDGGDGEGGDGDDPGDATSKKKAKRKKKEEEEEKERLRKEEEERIAKEEEEKKKAAEEAAAAEKNDSGKKKKKV